MEGARPAQCVRHGGPAVSQDLPGDPLYSFRNLGRCPARNVGVAQLIKFFMRAVVERGRDRDVISGGTICISSVLVLVWSVIIYSVNFFSSASPFSCAILWLEFRAYRWLPPP